MLETRLFGSLGGVYLGVCVVVAGEPESSIGLLEKAHQCPASAAGLGPAFQGRRQTTSCESMRAIVDIGKSDAGIRETTAVQPVPK